MRWDEIRDFKPFVASGTKTCSDWANEPDFEGRGRGHDWRNHVPELIRELWPDIPFVARVMAVYMANREADQEEWD